MTPLRSVTHDAALCAPALAQSAVGCVAPQSGVTRLVRYCAGSLALQWLDKAERDLPSALRLLEGEPPFPDTAVYHCQQAAEKALKAFLAARNRPGAVSQDHGLAIMVKDAAAGVGWTWGEAYGIGRAVPAHAFP